MNKIILTGNLGHSATVRDVEKADKSGTSPVVNFSLAVKIGYGEQAQTVWYGCAWWGERAVKVSEWLSRGRRVLVEGEPGLRTWTKRDGSGMGAEITVRVSNLELLGDGREASAPSRDAIEHGDTSRTEPPAKAAENLDEDVPF